MKELRHCEECRKPIKWDDVIIKTEDDDLYHEDCCTVFPIMYGVMVGDKYQGNAYDGVQEASMILGDGEYIDIEEDEEE